MRKIVFICGAKDFHAMDKFRLTSDKLGSENVLLLTDTIEGEGQSSKLMEHDEVFTLFNIDKFTFNKQSRLANLWRNGLKMLVIPIQILRLRKFYQQHKDYLYHAIPMYYMLLCKIAGIRYIGTPQGSEVLVRPYRSKLYAYFAKKALLAADKIIVDSVNMQNGVRKLVDRSAIIMKNGFNTSSLLSRVKQANRTRILSIRSIHELYNIDKILDARNRQIRHLPIDFIYPASEALYFESLQHLIHANDQWIGRLDRHDLYTYLSKAKLVISIPYSDSSPRSVYESIFAGSAVAIQFSEYYNELPSCMKDRIILIDLDNPHWLTEAISKAEEIVAKDYIPSADALEMCDENITIQKIISQIYYN